MKPPSPRSLVAGILVLVALGLLVLSLSGFLESLQGAALTPVAAVQEWIAVRLTALRNVLAAPSDVAVLRRQNAALQEEVSRLQREVIELREQAAEAEILGGLFAKPDHLALQSRHFLLERGVLLAQDGHVAGRGQDVAQRREPDGDPLLDRCHWSEGCPLQRIEKAG